jgi:hypothetical protein
MVVNFTPNIGLAKPTEAELSLEWARTSKLQEDNNLIIIDKMDVNLVAYTPVLAAQTTAPTVGTGFTEGEYMDFQGFIMGTFCLEFFDAGITVGSGEYGISLPAVVDNSYHSVGTAFNQNIGQFHCIGEGYIWDNSSVGNSGSVALDAVTVGGVSYARLVTETFVGKTSRLFRDSMPFALATNDKITGSFLYKKA